MKLEKLYTHFHIKLQKQEFPTKSQLKKEKESNDENNSVQFNSETMWDPKVLPETSISASDDLKNQSKNEEISQMEVSHRKMTKILHCINLEQINKLSAKDLVEYDGFNHSQTIIHIININKSSQNYLNTLEYKDLKKMAKEAELLKNYNIIQMIVTAMQTKDLDHKKVEDVVFYKNLLLKQDRGVVPLDWMLKDCADSNLNVESEVASVRFCTIIEKLNEMQGIEPPFPLKDKYKHYALLKLSNFTQDVKTEEEEIKHSEYLYLVI